MYLANMENLNNLPCDVLFLICKNLPPNDVRALFEVPEMFYKYSKEDYKEMLRARGNCKAFGMLSVGDPLNFPQDCSVSEYFGWAKYGLHIARYDECVKRIVYVNGVKHGRYEVLFDGRIHKLSHFRNGKLHGRSRCWAKNGRKTYDAKYVDGEIQKIREWDLEGRRLKVSLGMYGKKMYM